MAVYTPKVDEAIWTLAPSWVGVTSIYLQGIDSAEIVAIVHKRTAPVIPAAVGLRA